MKKKFRQRQQQKNARIAAAKLISTQHAATFRKTIARQWIIYSFVAKETTKGIHYGNCINRKKNF